MKEQFTRNERSSSHFERALNEYIHARLVAVAEELAKEDIVTLVLTGTESQSLFDMFAQAAGGHEIPSFTAEQVEEFYQRIPARQLHGNWTNCLSWTGKKGKRPCRLPPCAAS